MTTPPEMPSGDSSGPASKPMPSLEHVLGVDANNSYASRYRRWLTGAVMVAIALLSVYAFWGNSKKTAVSPYITEQAEIGTLIVKVSATGNLQPTNKVDVGSELSGIVEAVYVDDNDQVKKGQLLARLDLSRLQDSITKSMANLAVAEARVLEVKATVAEARANRDRFLQVAEMSGGKVPSKGEMDAAEASLRRAQANEASANAGVIQARASLKTDETNLAKAHIRSPINGVVLMRQVEPGQTVAASFTAPVMFTLAEDLAKMELQVDIDEADVGLVKVGQSAVFTVDAWPGREYPASITRVGFGAVETEGVISYPATLTVENSDISLRPGMTATAEITTLVHEKALLIPNAALRFTPPVTAVKVEQKSGGVTGFLMPRRSPQRTSTKVVGKDGSQEIWVLRNAQAVPISVKTGASNGRQTEIISGDIQAGMEIITGAAEARP